MLTDYATFFVIIALPRWILPIVYILVLLFLCAALASFVSAECVMAVDVPVSLFLSILSDDRVQYEHTLPLPF